MGPLASPFARKLIGAVLATVLVLATGLAISVNRETSRQVEIVSERTLDQAERSLEVLEERERQLLNERLGPVLFGARADAALEAFVAGADSTLVDAIEYQIELYDLGEELLLAFHDADGFTVHAQAGGMREGGADAWELRAMTDGAFDSEDGTASGYRVIDDRVYRVETRVVETVDGYVTGFVTVGFRIAPEDVAEVGALITAELCFFAGQRCIVGTPAARNELAGLFAAATAREQWESGMLGMYSANGGDRWEVLALRLEGAATRAPPAQTGGEPTGGEAAGLDVPASGAVAVSGDGASGGVAEGGAASELRLALAVPLEPVLVPFERIERTLLFAVAGSMLLAAIVAGLIAHGLTGPVVRLTAATRRVADGDYDTRVRVESRDEIGDLAGAFNEMTEGLRLKERYRGVLNKVVAPEVAEELMGGEVVLGGELRHVTVLFGDLRGFTATTASMPPQEVIGMLNEFMAALAGAVDREGGVVDKFVGDEIMAVFGAPISRRDDAARALRAAKAMQGAMTQLNADRAGRGETPLGLGIGINTGEAVAGNMGSPDRLNYTVLGRTVNLAARLCSSAEAGEILVGEDTAAELEGTGADTRLESAGARPFKGFDAPLEVFRALAVAALVLIGGSTVAPAPTAAQEWPQLRDRAYWSNASGSVQAGLSGRFELEAWTGGSDGQGFLKGPNAAPRLRLWGDLFVGDWLQLLIEARADRGDVPAYEVAEARFEQAWARVASGPVALTLGRFPSPTGGYAERHLTEADPFIRPAVPYDQQTVVSDLAIPDDLDGFLAWHREPGAFRSKGLAPLWQVPYPWGARLDLGSGATGVHLAYTNSAPSSRPAEWALTRRSLENPTWVVGARTAFGPEWRIGAWWSKGPWLLIEDESRPEYDRLTGYDQTLVGGQIEWRRGAMLARVEGWFDDWEVPGTGGVAVREIPWSAMLQRDLAPGLYLAGRIGGIRYLDVERPDGSAARWDDDVWRAELGAGYRLAVNAGVRATIANTFTAGPREAEDGYFGVLLWWEF